jgi:hypothetical protein
VPEPVAVLPTIVYATAAPADWNHLMLHAPLQVQRLHDPVANPDVAAKPPKLIAAWQ